MINSKTYKRYYYEKTPLQEAIFEARFLDESYDLTSPGRFFDRISSKFPNKNEIQNNAILISSHPFPNIQVPIMQAWDENHTSCLQIGPGIIAANDTAYLNWERFSSHIKILLNGYFDCATPLETQRIGYRCINRFFIPNENVILSEYFRLEFALPNELKNPKGLGFNISKELIFENINISVIVRFSSDNLRENEKGVAFLLDIDSFVIKDLGVDKQKILRIVSHCHELEKNIFESLLQDKMRNLLGGKLT